MMNYPFFVYDAFTEQRFAGNSAGVVLMDEPLTACVMQRVASELPLSTTVFGRQDADKRFSARYFTPSVEIGMCGHATIALFAALYDTDRLPSESQNRQHCTLETPTAPLQITVAGDEHRSCQVFIEFPVPTYDVPDVDHSELAALLWLPPSALHAQYPIERATGTLTHLLVPISDLEHIGQICCQHDGLAALCRDIGADTVMVFTAQTADPGHHLHGRDFCPAIGNIEEPASGTSGAALAAYALNHGIVTAHASRVCLDIEQGHELGRPSLVRAALNIDDGRVSSIEIGGTAVQILSGELHP